MRYPAKTTALPGQSVDRASQLRLANPIMKDLRSCISPDGADDPDTSREDIMLTRRGFAGFASCALCGLTEFIATEASAQGAPPAATGGVTRKILSQTDGPTPGYTTLLVEATIEPGVSVGRHTHPGIESAYVMEGGFELPIQGQATRMIKKGDAVQIPPETPHAGGKPGDAKTVILITYVVEKGKPLASPA
jgi:quercetin dioxygenase-like cupin family protein